MKKNQRELRNARDKIQLADGYVPMEAAAKALGVSGQRAYALAAKGKLVRRKVGGSVYVLRASIKEYQKSITAPAGWVHIEEAARRMSYARSTLMCRIRANGLGRKHIGTRTFVDLAELKRLFAPAA